MVKSMQPSKTEVSHLHKNGHNMHDQLILENEMN